MAARKKAKSSRRAKAKKSKRIAKRAAALKLKKAAKKVSVGKRIAKKRAAPRRPRRTAKQARHPMQVPATETVVVDTIDEPAPGVVVVTETEYAVRTDET